MSHGANSVHAELRTELENYIKSQYFGKSPLLFSAVSSQLSREGVLYQKPYIESSPAYEHKPDGIQNSKIPGWMKEYFEKLSDAGLGVFSDPYVHQIESLEAFLRGEDLFVATATGSGKTECFTWPILAKLASEAKSSPVTWEMRGIRVLILYPMNALVSDQVSRLRRTIGDQDNNFLNIFRETCGYEARRPQFGMYSGRTPYPGLEPSTKPDQRLVSTLKRMTSSMTDSERPYFGQLSKEGRIPAKANMKSYLSRLHDSIHTPDPDDAELITRFEMQQYCPDILITNYSMLEYMLLRHIEAKIWSDTKKWLDSNPENKLLFVIDEAHMYRGSSGGEVAFLIRRFFHKLGISRDRVQFILTTASMPDNNEKDRQAVIKFANELTASDGSGEFCYLTGKKEELLSPNMLDIPFEHFMDTDPACIEDERTRLEALNSFWNGVEGIDVPFTDLESSYSWMYDHLTEYRPFFELIHMCRKNAVSLQELSNSIFPGQKDDSLQAVSVLLAIAPLARNEKDAVLFPARMHMFFRGIKGVYACTNPECSHSHSDGGLTLGEIFLSDDKLICPYCGSVVYELYNDRRCGALFYRGYVLAEDTELRKSVYLWHFPGMLMDSRMKEIHLFIPSDTYELPRKQGSNPIRPCYLDVKTGFINMTDDSLAGQPGIRKLYYCNFFAKGRPSILTFSVCPHCRHQLSSTQLTPFSTRGNQSFYNLIKAQFQAQPAVPGKDQDPDRFPNEGRKVLLFSDSRQRAAKLARDMSESSDLTAARQLFVLAVSMMEQSTLDLSMNELYNYFCLAASLRHVQIFHDKDKDNFISDCNQAKHRYDRDIKHGKEYKPRFTISNAPIKMQEYILRFYSGGYNTLYDSAISWVEPTRQALEEAVDALDESGISVSEDEFLQLFNAWMINDCDPYVVLGHVIKDEVRQEVRQRFGNYGLHPDWDFSTLIKGIMGWENNSNVSSVWRRVFRDTFLDSQEPDNGRLYVDLSRVIPRFDTEHVWYRCRQCSEITPFLLRNRCPCCGSQSVEVIDDEEFETLSFWRKPVFDALKGEKIRVIDTEEHTAQLSHLDQRDDMWSKTEEYELRFQDFIQDNETPVDILSSTTTMEVGIDIGSLVAIGLRNIPPMRENYQQRAGRAGRRGSSLSTIVTFCEDGPHDTLYFNNPVPMLRGDPRRPWIDTGSEKLLYRHLAMVVFQEYLERLHLDSMDKLSAADFLDHHLDSFLDFVKNYRVPPGDPLVPVGAHFDTYSFYDSLTEDMTELKKVRDDHPELFGVDVLGYDSKPKVLLDVLYEEGIVPTFSFPKNVVNTYILDQYGKIRYEVDRGLDIAISEYAPGRSIVVDKQTYQIGGFYYPGSERRRGKNTRSPARGYIEDPNYLKTVLSCSECGWFGLATENLRPCPFCGNTKLKLDRKMLRPWGYGPKDGKSISEAQLQEEYTSAQQPLYSTLPNSKDMHELPGCEHIRMASRTNQRIIIQNKGQANRGFMVCCDCGAAMPGDDKKALDKVERPYISPYSRGKCRHTDLVNVDLGYDFVTDMLVLEFALDKNRIFVSREHNPWLNRGAQSLAEALRLVASNHLDVEFSELVTGYRLRGNPPGTFVDIYLYDSLSSGAGYAVSVEGEIDVLLEQVEELLKGCTCDSACYNCLKHRQNQFVHGLLDRFAGLELLEWGTKGVIADALGIDEQKNLLEPFRNILHASGCDISFERDCIRATMKRGSKKVVVYPGMWVEPRAKDTIFVSDTYIKYAKPYAVQKILDEC